MLDWAREQGRVDDWRKVALSCVGLQRVAGSAKAVSWRHGALEEDNASLALGRVRGWADGQCGDVRVSRAGWATVAATGVRATTVGQRRGAWASDDDDDEERTATDGNVLTVVEVRRVRHDEAGGRRVQATPSTSRMGGTRATADRHAGRVHGGEWEGVVLDQAGGGRRRRLGGGVRATRVRRRDGQARCARRAAAVSGVGRSRRRCGGERARPRRSGGGRAVEQGAGGRGVRSGASWRGATGG